MTARRVCFVTTFYPPAAFGGDAVAVQRLARAFARRGWDVTVVHNADAYAALAGAHAGLPPIDPFGVKVVTLRSRFPKLTTLLLQQTGRPVAHARRLGRFLDDGGFDTIVFNNTSLIGGPGVLACGRHAVKIYIAHEHWLVCPTHVLWRHNREPCSGRQCLRCQVHYRRPPQAWRHLGRLGRDLAHIDTFVAMSEFSRAKHREFGFPREMTVLPYFTPDPVAVDPPADTAEPGGRPYFLFVGRLERLKGLDDVLDAFGRYDGADLVVAGEGTHGDALRRRAAGNPRVRFVGRVPNERLAACYRGATALIVPSTGFETFGLTLIEGFSHGTPVIARRRGSFPEIVERAGGGLLFESQEDLLAAMRSLQTDAALRARLARAGEAAFRRYWSEDVVVPRYLEIVEEARARRLAVTA
ncbi:MAG TPA: glycosyltransferase family 4 protein [Vicinamibacterales bacterium]|nr:glycosyltransferase family 4 protein [Vicinamibacterales bacterium]